LVGFHSDGSPVQIDLNLTFQEIELQVSGDAITGAARAQAAAVVLQAQSAKQEMDIARGLGLATTGGPPNRNMVVTN
jgi:hypothetical protein